MFFDSVPKIGDQPATTDLTIIIKLDMKGEVSIWWFSIYLQILLEAEYKSDGSLIGRGSVYVRIKISRFFTKKFRRSFTYTLQERKKKADSEQLLAFGEMTKADDFGSRMDAVFGSYV